LLALAAMATRFELVLPEVPRDRAASARLRAVGEAALDELRAVEARWSLFRRDSFLQHLLAAAPTAPVRLDVDDCELFDAAARVFRASGGAFDPCVAPAVAAAGFERPATVHAAVRGTFADVELDSERGTVRFARAGLALDFGGIAKGHALDRAARVLREGGVRAALLHGGTSAVVALGAPADAAAWSVQLGAAVDAPRLTLCDQGLALSASASQRSASGRGHVLDPRAPARELSVRAAAVRIALADDPAALAVADATATALLVTGAPLPLDACEQHLADGDGAWRSATPTSPTAPRHIHDERARARDPLSPTTR